MIGDLRDRVLLKCPELTLELRLNRCARVAFIPNLGPNLVGRKERQCHHLSAFTFEQVMKQVKARYVVGLTDRRCFFPIPPLSTKTCFATPASFAHDNKRFVQVFDYVDSNVLMLARMFERRLKGYGAIGYVIEREPTPPRAAAAHA